MAISSSVPETKYGNTISASPHASGTIARCFLPYTKKPSPIDPNSMPQSSVDAFKATSAVSARMAGSYSSPGRRIQGHVSTRTSPGAGERANLCAGESAFRDSSFYCAMA